MKPTPGYVIIKPDEFSDKTEEGLYVPEDRNQKPEKGEVIAVGEEQELKPTCEAGDRVIYKKWAGHTIKHEGNEYQFVKFDEVLAII